MSASTALKRSLIGACMFGGTGIVVGAATPPLLFKMGLIYSSSVIQTSFFAGALVLTPVGAADGVLNEARVSLVQSGVASDFGRDLFQRTRENMGDVWNESQAAGLSLLDKWAASPLTKQALSSFVPSTVNMMDEIKQAVDSQAIEGNIKDLDLAEVAAKASASYCDIFLNDMRHTVLRSGGLLYVLVLGAGIAVDFAYGTILEKARVAKQKLVAEKEAALEKVNLIKEKAKEKTVATVGLINETTKEELVAKKEAILAKADLIKMKGKKKAVETAESIKEMAKEKTVETKSRIKEVAEKTTVNAVAKKQEMLAKADLIEKNGKKKTVEKLESIKERATENSS